MEVSGGTVRAVLQDHVRSQGANSHGSDDPSAVIPAADLRRHLEEVRQRDGDAAVRRLAHDYVRLWARTFRTLVKHLRGRPERTLSLWCQEVYPFLRGDRRAARIEHRSRTEAHVSLADDLPAPYLAGLLEAFVALSGATTTARSVGRETFSVTYHIHPSDQAARAVHWIAGLRIPLLATAGLAAWTAVAWAMSLGIATPLVALVVIAGTIAAQSGANAVRDLRERELGPLSTPRTGPAWRWFQAIGSYTVAAAALTYLVSQSSISLLAFAGAGLVLGTGYAMFSDHGFGPAIAALAQGPLIVLGAAWAFSPSLAAEQFAMLAVAGLGPGLLAATMLFVGDLSDRPIDEAGGRRTLAVRLPHRRNVLVLATMSLVGVAIAAGIIAAAQGWMQALWFLPSAGIALALAREVHRTLDDPHGMARARGTAMALHFLTTLLLSLLLIQKVIP